MWLQNHSAGGSAGVQCVTFLVMKEKFNGLAAPILKEDGCTSNFISREFASVYAHSLSFKPVLVDVNH